MRKIRVVLCVLLAFAFISSHALAFEGLKKGNRSMEVQYLQLRLNELGYSVGTADGDYGKKTVTAVEAFQKDHGLEATGEVDEATWNALYDMYVTVTRDNYSAEVKLVPPFTDIVQDTTSAQTALLHVADVTCAADLIYYSSLETLVSDVESYYKDHVFADAVDMYQASNYQIKSDFFEVDGRNAASITVTFDIKVNGSKLISNLLWGAVELDEDGDRKVMARSNLSYSLNPRDTGLITEEAMREILANIRLTSTAAPAASDSSDPILGDWYTLRSNMVIVITFNADGTYRANFGDESTAAGVWSSDGNGYSMDDGNLKVTLDGESLTLGEGDSADVFQREPIAAPELPLRRDATEADYAGLWKASGLYECDTKGFYEKNLNCINPSTDIIQVTVEQDKLTIDGLLFKNETYDVSFTEGCLYLTTSEVKDPFFNGGEMHLLEDGTSIIFTPGSRSICLVLEKQ